MYILFIASGPEGRAVVIVFVFFSGKQNSNEKNSGTSSLTFPDRGSDKSIEVLSDDSYTRSTTRKSTAVKNQKTLNMPDRTTPTKAYATLIDCLSNRDLKEFHASFSEKGRYDLMEGRVLSEEDLEAMDDAFKRAGFASLQIESQTVEVVDDLVKVTGSVSSTRNGQVKKEVITAVFENVEGNWLVSKFTATPDAEKNSP